MNLVRRIIVVLVGISLAILVTFLLINPDTVLSLAANLNDTSLLIRLPLAILLDAVVLAVIVVLLRGERAASARSNGGLLVRAQGAVADISVESARERVLRAVRAVPDVLSAEVEVKTVRGKADIELDVVVSREHANLPEKQKEIDRALRQVLNKQLGLQIAGKPRVHIRMDDEKSVLAAVAVPEARVPVAVVEPVKQEVAIPTSVKTEAFNYTGSMSLRSDDEPEPSPESVDPLT